MNKKKKRENEVSPPWFDENAHIKRKLVRFFIHLFAWIGIATLFYVGFSFFFDTPIEYRMKMSTKKLSKQYDILSGRYDTIQMVLDNVVERDRSVFKTLFEAEPYDFDSNDEDQMWEAYEKLLTKTNRVLGDQFTDKSRSFEKRLIELNATYESLMDKMEVKGMQMNNIPAIQPVLNKDLTLLTASFGLRINPFYKVLSQHHGVDFSVTEGTRVFATADGVVRDIIPRVSTTGQTLMVSHADRYLTTYGNLSKILVSKGQSVKRGEIIALSGNTGQSLAPHLHYEISKNGMRVDPIHYFFMELTPAEYEKMMKIAQSGMQSFD